MRWRVPTNGSIRSSPAVVNGTVYVGSEDGNLYAIGGDTGLVRWRAPIGATVSSSPVVANGTVYIGTTEREGPENRGRNGIVAVNAATGETGWSFSTAGPVVGSPVVVQEAIVVGDIHGRLYLLVSCDAWELQQAGVEPVRQCTPATVTESTQSG